jgi:hypothetical protein
MSKNRNTGAAPRAAVPDSAPDAAAVAAQASVEVPPVSSFDAPVQPSNGSPGAIMLQLPLDAVRPGTYAERRLSDLSAPEARIAARLLAGAPSAT